MNLAVKLCITNPKQTKLLCQYVMNLAKYDQNYDIRDRSRFLRQFVLATDKPCALAKYAKKIFLATKPAPVLESLTKGKYGLYSQISLFTLIKNSPVQNFKMVATKNDILSSLIYYIKECFILFASFLKASNSSTHDGMDQTLHSFGLLVDALFPKHILSFCMIVKK